MNTPNLFLLPDGRPRTGWRFLLFLICYLLVTALLVWFWPSRYSDFSLSIWREVAVRMFATLGVSWAMLRVVERRSFREIGTGFLPGWTSALGLGAASGAVMVMLTGGILALSAGVKFEPASMGTSTALLRLTPLLLLSAASEEWLFRGYPFQLLVEGTGRVIAVGGTSLLFGVLHLSNPAANAISTTNTVLAGALFALAYLQAGSLWYAIGMHFSWNWTLGACGFAVSGIYFPSLGWTAVGPAKSAWLHGGAYGPEGGVVCTAVLLLTIAGLWVVPNRLGCRRLVQQIHETGRNHQDSSKEPWMATANNIGQRSDHS